MSSETASFQMSARQAFARAAPAGEQGLLQRKATRHETVCKAGFSGRQGRSARGWGSGSNGRPWFYRVGTYGLGVGAGSYFWFGEGRMHAYADPLFPLTQAVKKRPKKGKRVMVLMSDTGGGHRASALALKEGFEKLYGSKYEVSIVDLWSNYCPWPHNQLPKSYNTMVHHPWMWRLTYVLTMPRMVHRTLARLTAWQVAPGVSRAFDEYDPDLVVSVHPLMQDVPLRVLRRRIMQGRQRPINFATVVTDLTTCHNTWFHPAVTKCFVPTQEAARRAARMGLQEQQVVVHGLPIRPDFARRCPAKPALRRKLGLRTDMKTVLLIGGGEGMGPVEKTVVALAKAQVPCQVVVACGKNAKLLRKIASREYPECMHVVAKGFINNMADWMCACDAIITKAGPGTISEALICGLPILINANVPCQEEGNIPYVVDNEVGAHERNPVKAAAIIRDWFSPAHTQQLADMAARARAMGRPDGLYKIVKDLRALVAP